MKSRPVRRGTRAYEKRGPEGFGGRHMMKTLIGKKMLLAVPILAVLLFSLTGCEEYDYYHHGRRVYDWYYYPGYYGNHDYYYGNYDYHYKNHNDKYKNSNDKYKNHDHHQGDGEHRYHEAER
jgi:hypothetical protein